MDIRKATEQDLDGIRKLLFQVNNIHADHRPDLFKSGGIKYTDEELKSIFHDPDRPVFVAADENGTILGYVFCIVEMTQETTSLRQVKTLYIDDLCVDSDYRGGRIGSRLYEYAKEVAKEAGCSRLTLHAWNFNENAFAFYQKMGMTPLVTTMEQRL